MTFSTGVMYVDVSLIHKIAYVTEYNTHENDLRDIGQITNILILL
jgi:hypothetical protein